VGFKGRLSCSESNCRIPVHVVAAAALQCNDERAEEERTLNRKSLTRSPGPICNAKFSRIGEKWRTAGTDQQGDARKKRHFWMPSRAWRSGLEPAELSFRVPHFFHQTRKGPRGAMVLNNADFTGIQKLITDSTRPIPNPKGRLASATSPGWTRLQPDFSLVHSQGKSRHGERRTAND
jgi:hypothetical protein